MFHIEGLFEKAVFYENRNYIEESKKVYRKIICDPAATVSMMAKACHLFYRSGDVSDSYQLSKRLMIEGESIETFGSIFLSSAKAVSENLLSDIRWLMNQPGFHYNLDLYFACLVLLGENGSEVYLESIELYEKISGEFEIHGQKYARLYNQVTLFVLEQEYMADNIPQARFHLRKLLSLHRDDLYMWNEVAEWAIILDVLPLLLKRRDILTFKVNVCAALLAFIQFYEKIRAGKLEQEDIERLHQADVSERLAEKRLIYFMQGKKMSGGSLSEEEINFLLEHPNDWLAVYLLLTELGLQASSFFTRVFASHADLSEAVSCFYQLVQGEKPRKQKDLSKVEVRIVGGGHKIGGTSILISVDGHRLLLDAGIHLDPGEDMLPDYSFLQELGLSFDNIDALVISHAHLDHTGAVPHVYRLGPHMPMYATEATYELMSVLLKDVCRTNSGREGFYNERDLQAALLHIETRKVHESFTIPSGDKEWKVTFFSAGHIVGAAAVLLEMDDISILFTGDYSVEDQLTVEGMRLPQHLQADIVITESTYGFLPSQGSLPRKWQERQLLNVIDESIQEGGSVLIPAFALGRAQEILLIIKSHFQKLQQVPYSVYIDGLVPEICKVYEKYMPGHSLKTESSSLFFSGGIQAVREQYRGISASETAAQLANEQKNVIVASSGMLQAGSASSRYAAHMLKNPENAIIFTGYLDEESPGFSIHQLQTEKKKEIKIENQEIEVKAKIRGFRLSAHAGREEMVQTVLSLHPQTVFLVHGEHDKKYRAPRSYEPITVYPTMQDLLEEIGIDVIPAVNGMCYRLTNQGGEKHESAAYSVSQT